MMGLGPRALRSGSGRTTWFMISCRRVVAGDGTFLDLLAEHPEDQPHLLDRGAVGGVTGPGNLCWIVGRDGGSRAGAGDPGVTLDVEHLRTWIGKQETLEDRVTPVPVAALAATLDRDDPPPREGDALPPLWHWLYFLPVARQSELGPDGHPRRGGFLPPVPLPRRMWAGSRFQFRRPLHVGEAMRRKSVIADVSVKDGRTGPLVFVLVRHEISGEAGVALTEEHDIVYRNVILPRGAARHSPPPGADFVVASAMIVPDPVLLFRYSALTFTGHRIHYDRSYVTGEEGYPGLVVHGPLLATLLVDLLRRNSAAQLTGFRFRAMRPLFDISPFAVCGAPGEAGKVALWAQDEQGFLCMDAEALTDSGRSP